jgi:hypothetical protein
MPQPAILPIYSPLNLLIFDLNNFTLVPHPNHCELIWKFPKKLASS